MSDPRDRTLTFDEREAAAHVMWVYVTYLTAAELKGQRRPDYIKAMHDLQHVVKAFKGKLAEDREQAAQDEKASARKGRVDDSGWSNDQINDEIAKMADMLKGLGNAE